MEAVREELPGGLFWYSTHVARFGFFIKLILRCPKAPLRSARRGPPHDGADGAENGGNSRRTHSVSVQEFCSVRIRGAEDRSQRVHFDRTLCGTVQEVSSF
jgi:hypothetical protein